MKFGGHETFPLRDNWLFKGIVAVNKNSELFRDPDEAVATLGVGMNMVTSLKYWLVNTTLVKSDAKGMKVSALGKFLERNDKYFDSIGTGWLLHYFLVTDVERATTWYWFFNKLGASEFSHDSALHYLEAYVASHGKKIKQSTLKRDLDVLLRMYVAPDFNDKQTPEDNYTCPLSQLGLIRKHGAKGYRMNKTQASQISSSIFAYLLTYFWETKLNSVPSFSFEMLTSRDGSPGKVLSLGPDMVLELLDQCVELFPKCFNYSRSGGLFNVNIKAPDKMVFLKNYYGSINGSN